MKVFSIRQPDDWHCHLREGERLVTTVLHQANQFSRALVMPNLQTPVSTFARADLYRKLILSCLPKSSDFFPVMTLYLTQDLTSADLESASKSGFVKAVKFYPQGATTLSEYGVQSWRQVIPQLEKMQELGLVLCIHGEVTHDDVDIFERESVFLHEQLQPILSHFPDLKVVLEHISTAQAVKFVQQTQRNLAATITPHHLLLNRNDLLAGGLRPHHYCLPIVKKQDDQEALVKAAISGDPRFFLGTDSAPHAKNKKESACGCAGIYSAYAALEYYAEVFYRYDSLDKLSDFASVFGADFYGLPLNQKQVQLRHDPWIVPDLLSFGDEVVVPFMAGQTLQWKRVNNE